MKRNIYLFTTLCFLSVLLIFSCKKTDNPGSVSAVNDTPVRQEVDIKIYNEIKVEGAIDVFYESKPDDAAFLEVEASKSIIPLVDIKVKGKTLHIKSRESINPGRLVVYTNSPTLKYVEAKGASSVSISGASGEKVLKLELKGTGNIHTENLMYEKTEAKLEGSGNITLAGESDKAKYEINGNGNISAENMLVKELECKIKGTGNMLVNAIDKMSIDVSGKGDISYNGDPQITRQKIKGAGSVRKI